MSFSVFGLFLMGRVVDGSRDQFISFGMLYFPVEELVGYSELELLADVRQQLFLLSHLIL